MNMNELLELQARLWAAKVNKHLIGAASGYAEALEKEAGPVDFDGQKHSPDHLLALVEKAIRVRNAPKAPEKSKAKPASKVMSGTLREMPSEHAHKAKAPGEVDPKA